MRYRGFYGMAMKLFLIVVIANTGFVIDTAQSIGRPCLVQYRLSQRGLARAAVTHYNYVAYIAGTCHFQLSKLWFLWPVCYKSPETNQYRKKMCAEQAPCTEKFPPAHCPETLRF
jgi:hypothetical protein